MRAFYFVVLLTTAIIFLYLLTRLTRPLHGTRWRKRAVAALLLAIAVAQVTIPALHRFLSDAPADLSRMRPLYWGGYAAMGFSFILFFFVMATDAGRFSVIVARWLVRCVKLGTPKAWKTGPVDPSRRVFLSQGTSYGLLGVSALSTGIGAVQAEAGPKLVEVDVPIQGLPPGLDGYSIAQITDLHVGPTIGLEYVEDVVRRTSALGADLIAVTGDMVDGTVAQLGPAMEPFAALRARDGVFFVTGNHEYYWDSLAWIEKVRGLGMTPLVNEHRLIERPGGRILVAGVTDESAGMFLKAHDSDPKRAIHGAPAADVRILLAHRPNSCRAAEGLGFHLQLSGHTHGGQLYPWALFVGLAHDVVKGLEWKRGHWVYVSTGTGYWGPPVRLGVPSEITRIRLTRA